MDFKGRIVRLQEQLSTYHNSALLIANPKPVLRSNDVHYSYRGDSTVYYFTGLQIPDIALLVTADETTIFAPRLTDLQKLWEGDLHHRGMPLEEYLKDLDIEYILYDNSDIIKNKLPGGALFYQKGGSIAAKIAIEIQQSNLRRPPQLIRHDLITAPLRAVKGDDEIGMIESSIQLTWEHLQIIQSEGYFEVGSTEREIANRLYALAIESGGHPAFLPIVASGKNAAVIHYHDYLGAVEKNKTLLIDTGVESDFYCSDITRTFPQGRFSPQQRDIYELLLSVKRSAESACGIGVDFFTPEKIGREAFVEGLKALGIVNRAIEDEIAKELKSSTNECMLPIDPLVNAIYRKFGCHFMVAHLLGIDVHDTDFLFDRVNQQMLEGMVLTIEPGFYSQQLVNGYEPIGMRIEDDIVISASGFENLSSMIPISIEEVEQFVSE